MTLALAPHFLYPLLLFTGLAAGFIDSIAGGGGLISIPMLLGVGIPPQLALGTNKLQSSIGTFVATYSYYRQGWRANNKLFQGLICSFSGAVIGAVAAQKISGALLSKIIPILLFAILIYTLCSPHLGREDRHARMSESSFYLIFGTLFGFYDGFLGPGVGSFWLFGMVLLLGYNFLTATAYTKLFNLNTNVTALICFALGGYINYKIGLVMAVGQVIGARLGARLAIKSGSKMIRPVFLVIVSLTVTSLLYKNFGQQMDFKQFIAVVGWVPVFMAIALVLILLVIYLFRRKTKVATIPPKS